MSMNCRSKPKNTTCSTREISTPVDFRCEPLSVCLGAGRTLTYNGVCFSVEGNVTIPDGNYTQITFKDGCIVAATTAPLPQYTPPPCAPMPGGSGGSGGTDIPISPESGNLIEKRASGYYAGLRTQSNAQVTFSGDGTTQNPLRATVNVEKASISITSGDTSMDVTGDGSTQNPYRISQKTTGLVAGYYAGFQIDQWGRIISFTDPNPNGIRTIMNGVGTTVENNLGVVQVNVSDTDIDAGTYRLGAYMVMFNQRGQAEATTRVVDVVNPGTYNLDGYNVTISTFGDIESIEEREDKYDHKPQEWVAYFEADAGGDAGDGRVMSFDLPENGILHVEYIGQLKTTKIPQATPTTPITVFPKTKNDGITGAKIVINNKGLAGVFTDYQYGMTYELVNTTQTLRHCEVATACRGTTSEVVAKGQVTVEVYPPNGGNMVTTAGFIRVSLVARV